MDPAVRTPRWNPLLWPRVRAYALDCVGYAGIAVLEVPLGLYAARTPLASNVAFVAVASSIPPAVATVWAARAEAGSARATHGKRREGLAVSFDGHDPSVARALARNVAKIALPWTLGHVVVYGAARGGFERNDPVLMTALVGVYGWAIVTAAMVALGSGRAPHDHLADTTVVAVDHARQGPAPANSP